MSILTTTLYAQSPEDIELSNRVKNLVITNIPNLAGKDFLVTSINDTDHAIISKINNVYTYYFLRINRYTSIEVTGVKTINASPILDKIFTNFTPKPNVKRYVSEYGPNILTGDLLGTYLFALYKNGNLSFDFYLPASINRSYIDFPIDDETLVFAFYTLISTPDQL